MRALRDTIREILEPIGPGAVERAFRVLPGPPRVRRSRIARLAVRALLRASSFPGKPGSKLAAATIGQAIVDDRHPQYRLEVLRFLRGPALGWLALLGLERAYAAEFFERAGVPVRAGSDPRVRPLVRPGGRERRARRSR